MAEREADSSLPLKQDKPAELMLSGPFCDDIHETLVLNGSLGWHHQLPLMGVRRKFSMTFIITSIVGLLLRMSYQSLPCDGPSIIPFPALVMGTIAPLPGGRMQFTGSPVIRPVSRLFCWATAETPEGEIQSKWFFQEPPLAECGWHPSLKAEQRTSTHFVPEGLWKNI